MDFYGQKQAVKILNKIKSYHQMKFNLFLVIPCKNIQNMIKVSVPNIEMKKGTITCQDQSPFFVERFCL
jgi:hypothetical protein